MSQNPYAQTSGFDGGAPAAPRTSVLAVLALVCSLVCFVPGLGLLAVVMGIAAIFMISGSQGRVTGKGLAVTGVVLGLLVSLLWGGGIIAAGKLNTMLGKQFMGSTTSFFQAAEAKNYAQARTHLNSPTTVTDEQFDEFLTAYQAKVGTFTSMPDGLISLVGAYTKLQGFNMSTTPGQFPIPAEFSNGTAVVILEMPTGKGYQTAPNPSAVPIMNIGVMSSDGTTVWLIPTMPAGGAGAPVTPPKGDAAPTTAPVGGSGG